MDEKARTGEHVAAEPRRLGRYTLTRHLGTGGMADVYLARQDGPGGYARTCVVKQIRKAFARNEHFVRMFLREARSVARLSHPNIVDIFELGEDGGEYFIAMEYVDGITMQRAARRTWARGGSLPIEVVLRVLADAALGLHHAHTLVDDQGAPSPLVHRDATPDNLILARDGRVKLLDFGVAKSTEIDDATLAGEIKGKTPYLSPEQVAGQRIDGRSDLWTLGVDGYYLLSGQRPFESPTDLQTVYKILHERPRPPRAINPRIPAIVSDLVMQLLSRDPAQRTGTGEELHDALNNLLGPTGGVAMLADFVARLTATAPAAEEDDDRPMQLRGPAAVPTTHWLKDLDEDPLGGATTDDDGEPLAGIPDDTTSEVPAELVAPPPSSVPDDKTIRIKLVSDETFVPDPADRTKPLQVSQVRYASQRIDATRPLSTRRPSDKARTAAVVLLTIVILGATALLLWSFRGASS